jgi:hypothetical protein
MPAERRYYNYAFWTGWASVRKLLTTYDQHDTEVTPVYDLPTKVYYGIRVFVAHQDKSLTEITSGTPVAVISKTTLIRELKTNAWDCPETVILTTDRIQVRAYYKIHDDGTWTQFTRGVWMTEELGVTVLNAATWTVWYSVTIMESSPERYQAHLDFGWPAYPSGVDNFTFGGVPPPAELIQCDGLVTVSI